MGNRIELTLGVSACLFGEGYSQFLPRWWAGIRSLRKQPTAIVIAHDELNKSALESTISEEYRSRTTLIEMTGTYADYRLASQAAQTTDWISICDIDDTYLPNAFDELDRAHDEGCDIYVDKLQMKHDGSIMEGRWIPDLIPYRMTCPANAPIKRELFAKTGGPTKGAIFDDWELYIRCVAAGAKPFHASTVRIIHDLGYDRVTMSGVRRPANHDEDGKAHIARVREQLGF